MGTIHRSANRTRRLVVLATVLALGALAVPASADIDQNPNAIPFGPVVCEGGLEFDLVYTPTEPAPVGNVVGNNTAGVATSLAVVLITGPDPLMDHVVLEQLSDRPGKGLDRNTVLCVWPSGIGPDVWLAAEILFSGGSRP